MRRFLSSAIFLMLSLPLLCAQDYVVELQPEKKVIYVDKLGLAENTPLLEVLRMLPELVVREGDDFIRGYDIFLDSKSLAYNKDVLLGTMKLYEVEKIEISTSATASQQRNGMAGAIKIVSRSMPEGFSGTVTSNLNTLWDLYPNMNLSYRKNKLELRGNVGLQLYSGGTSNYFESNFPPVFEMGDDTVNEKYYQGTSRLYMKYSPTSRDQFKFWVLESLDLYDTETLISSTSSRVLPDIGEEIYRVVELYDTTFAKTYRRNFSAFAEYEHTFGNGTQFNLSGDYILKKSKKGSLTLDGAAPEQPVVYRGESKIVFPLLPEGPRSMKFSTGANAEYDINDKPNVEHRSFYASPFVELKYDSPKFKLNTGLRYQYYNLVYDNSEQDLFSGGSNDITFNVNSLWQIVDHHALRFLVTKNIIRPTVEQMFPSLEWNSLQGIHVAGNNELRPAPMYSFEAEYITDWQIGDHKFVANLNMGYDRVDGLVEMVRGFGGGSSSIYMTYANSGINNIFKSMAQIMYGYGILSLSLAGNWYHNIKLEADGKDHIDNFNIALSPVFSFRNDWTLSGTFKFNNAVTSNTSREGECIYSYLRISKSFGKWIVNAAFSDIFGYVSENYEYLDGGYSYTIYDQYPRCFELGVTYRIGK